MISNLTYILTEVVRISSSRINEAASIAGTDGVEITNIDTQPVPTEMVGTYGNFNMLQWLSAIHGAVDTLELNVDNIENISLNTGDLEALQGSDDDGGTGDLAAYTYDSTNNILTDVRTAIELLDDAVITLGQLVGTAKGTLMAGSDGTNLQALATDANGKLQVAVTSQVPGVGADDLGKADNSSYAEDDVGVMSLAVRKDTVGAQSEDGEYGPLLTDDEGKLYTVDSAVATIAAAVANSDGTTTKPGSGMLIAGSSGAHLEPLLTDATGKLQVDIVAELPEGTKNIGHVDIDTLIPTANLDQKASSASLSVTPAVDIDDGTYVGDVKFGEAFGGQLASTASLSITPATDIADGTYIGDVKFGEAYGSLAKANSLSVTLATDDNLQDVIKTEDLPAADDDKGIAVMSVRRDTAAVTSGHADGDYQPLLTDDTGKLHVKDAAGAETMANSKSVTLATDDHLLSTIDKANDRINVNVDDATSTDGGAVPANGVMIGGTDGNNFQHLKVNTDGELFVNLEAANFNVGDVDIASATFEHELNDGQAADDKGVHILGVRKDTPASSGNVAAGDYSSLLTDDTGKLWTNTDLGRVHDAVKAATDKGVALMGVRKDDPVTGSAPNAEGDYQSLLTDSKGKLHVNAGPLEAQIGTVNIGEVSLLPSIVHGASLTTPAAIDGMAVGGRDSGDDFQMLNVETDGKLNVVSGTASEFKVTETDAGSIKTAVELLDDVHGTDGSAHPSKGVMIGGSDGVSFQNLAVTAAGIASVAGAVTTDVPSGTVAAAVGTTGIPVGGTDGSAFRHLKTNSSGELTVKADIVSGGFDGALTAAPGVEIGKLAVGTANIGNVKLGALAAGANAIGKLSANSGTDIGDVDILSLPAGNIGQRAKTASLSVTLASDDDLQTCINTTNDRLKVQIDSGAFDGTLTGLGQAAKTGSLSVTLANDDELFDCINSSSQLEVNIAGGGFDGVVTTAANTQLAVTTVQSAFDTGQNAAVGTTRVQVKSASQALQSGITVVASSANTASVFLGDNGVTSSGGTIGFELAAGAGFTFSLSNANLLYAISASGTQTVNFVSM